MKIKYLPLVLMLALVTPGCFSYRVFPKQYRDFKVPAATKTVYIDNPRLKRELSILKGSGIYNITDDSTCTSRIKLHRMEERIACGNGFAIWALFLGQFPMSLPDNRTYSFEEIVQSDTTAIKVDLLIVQRYWFWDIFSRKKDFNKEAGKALAANYYSQQIIKKTAP